MLRYSDVSQKRHVLAAITSFNFVFYSVKWQICWYLFWPNLPSITSPWHLVSWPGTLARNWRIARSCNGLDLGEISRVPDLDDDWAKSVKRNTAEKWSVIRDQRLEGIDLRKWKFQKSCIFWICFLIWIFHGGILDFYLWNGIAKSIPQNIKKNYLNFILKSCHIPWT